MDIPDQRTRTTSGVNQKQTRDAHSCRCPDCHDSFRKNRHHSLHCPLTQQFKLTQTSNDGLWSFTNDLIKQFSLRRVFNDHQSFVSSLDWDSSGECLLSCCRDSSATLHSVSRNAVRHLYSRKYGAESGRFVRGGQTHCIVSSKPPETTTKTCNAVLASIFDALYPNSAATIPMRSSSHALSVQNQSSTQEGALRHWDLIENRFIKTFNLQSPFANNSVLSVSRPPTNLVMAPCKDGIVRIFALDKDGPLATIESLTDGPQAMISESGTLAAIQVKPFVIQLFDFRNGWLNSDYFSIDLETLMPITELLGPSFKGSGYAQHLEVTRLVFDPFPLYLIVTLADRYSRTYLYQFDILAGSLIRVFRPPGDNSINGLILSDYSNACFPDISYDSKYLACDIWSLKTGDLVKTLDCNPKIPQFVKWNPTGCLLVSAKDHIAFWAP